MENIEKAQYLMAGGALLIVLIFLVIVFKIDILSPELFVITFFLGLIILLYGGFWTAYLQLKGSIIDDERTKKIDRSDNDIITFKHPLMLGFILLVIAFAFGGFLIILIPGVILVFYGGLKLFLKTKNFIPTSDRNIILIGHQEMRFSL